MKRIFILITTFFISFTLFNSKSFATINQENTLIEQSLSLVQDGDYVHAFNLLNQYEESYMKTVKKNRNYTPKELETISVTFQNALLSLENESIDPQEKIADVLGLRLLIDAEDTSLHPMWKEMKNSVMTPFNNMISSYKRGNSESYEIQLNEFLHQFEIIYPSLIIDLPYSEVTKINSLVSFLDEYRSNKDSLPAFKQKLDETQNELLFIFDQGNSIFTPTNLWTLITIGGIIIGTLGYVGWRKYLGERKLKKGQRDQTD